VCEWWRQSCHGGTLVTWISSGVRLCCIDCERIVWSSRAPEQERLAGRSPRPGSPFLGFIYKQACAEVDCLTNIDINS
jgi:hypothetical protein